MTFVLRPSRPHHVQSLNSAKTWSPLHSHMSSGMAAHVHCKILWTPLLHMSVDTSVAHFEYTRPQVTLMHTSVHHKRCTCLLGRSPFTHRSLVVLLHTGPSWPLCTQLCKTLCPVCQFIITLVFLLLAIGVLLMLAYSVWAWRMREVHVSKSADTCVDIRKDMSAYIMCVLRFEKVNCD